MTFDELVAKIIRIEIENFASGVGVRFRMRIIVEEVKNWRLATEKKIGKFPIMKI